MGTLYVQMFSPCNHGHPSLIFGMCIPSTHGHLIRTLWYMHSIGIRMFMCNYSPCTALTGRDTSNHSRTSLLHYCVRRHCPIHSVAAHIPPSLSLPPLHHSCHAHLNRILTWRLGLSRHFHSDLACAHRIVHRLSGIPALLHNPQPLLPVPQALSLHTSTSICVREVLVICMCAHTHTYTLTMHTHTHTHPHTHTHTHTHIHTHHAEQQ